MNKTLTLIAALALAAAAIPLTSSAATVAKALACEAPQADAHVTDAFPADMPEIAREMGATGTAYVQVDLLPSGDIADVSIAKTTGNAYLDHAALDAARKSRFSPEIRDCQSVGGTYLYVVDFSR